MTEARENQLAEDDEEEEGTGEGLLAGMEPAALLEGARERAVALVTQHPLATVAGAFALGFVLARIVKALGDD